MKNKLILIFIAILIMASVYCLAEDLDSTENAVKTGDIMVVARGCVPPPYENGLRLILNRMEFDVPPSIKKAPLSSMQDTHWIDSIMESSNNKDPKILDYLNYIYDSLNLKINLSHGAYIYSDDKLEEGITDSLGRYIFSDVPRGYYQLVLDKNEVPSASIKKSHSDSLFANREDFPEWNLIYPANIDWDLYEKPKGQFPIDNISCESGIINLIRVMPDSISIVKINANIHNEGNVFINAPGMWDKKIKPRDGQNEKRNKR